MKKKRVSESKIEDSDEESNSNPPKGRILDLNEIRSELKGINKVKLAANPENITEKDATSSDESTSTTDVKCTSPIDEIDKKEKPVEKTAPATTTYSVTSTDDIYEFKEPEPFEFETRKIVDDKSKKRLVPRVLDDTDKSPKKKIVKSPLKLEQKEMPEEKKRFKRSPLKKLEEVEIKDQPKAIDVKPKVEDPFDKLIESPSFVHVNKAGDKPLDVKKAVKNLTDDSLSLFRPITEYSNIKLDILTESSTEPYFTNKQQLFTDSNFAKEPDIMEEECLAYTKAEEIKKKSDGEDHIIESIQRVIAQSSLTDDDSSDSASNLLDFKSKSEISTQNVESEQKDKEIIKPKFSEEKEVKENIVLSKQMSTVFQGTDTNLLEQICTPQLSTKLDEVKDVVKTGTKIADSILQRFNLIKTKSDTEVKIQEESTSTKIQDLKIDPAPITLDFKSNPNDNVEFKPKTEHNIIPEKFVNALIIDVIPEKKRSQRKIVSKEFIDSDTDSDSEERLIIHSDDDSQTDTLDDNKPSAEDNIEKVIAEVKVEDERNFKIEDIKKNTSPIKELIESESVKEDEPDSHIHSLLCQETIPGSPAPSITEPKPKLKSIAEMPFASAPSSSNKSLLNNEISKPVKIERNPSPVIVHQVELKRADNRETSTVLDNTPPTTPESTISNLSPRG